ncbi:hypothetical protein D3C73_1458860 [compost metagenome]
MIGVRKHGDIFSIGRLGFAGRTAENARRFYGVKELSVTSGIVLNYRQPLSLSHYIVGHIIHLHAHYTPWPERMYSF